MLLNCRSESQPGHCQLAVSWHRVCELLLLVRVSAQSTVPQHLLFFSLWRLWECPGTCHRHPKPPRMWWQMQYPVDRTRVTGMFHHDRSLWFCLPPKEVSNEPEYRSSAY